MIMRYLALFTLLVFATSGLQAQTLTEKDLSSNGYGEKKFKKAPKRLYIQSFKVNFQVTAFAEASSQGGRELGGGSYSGDTHTSMTVMVDGVDTPDFMEVTDNLYQDFLADMTGQGFEIITQDQVQGTEYFNEWERREGGQINYANLPGYVQARPTGLDYYIKRETKKGKEKGNFIDKSCKLSKELDDAIICDVVFTFTFIEMKTSESGFIGFSSVKAKTNFEMEGENYVKFQYGNPAGLAAEGIFMMGLKKPVEIEAPVFSQEKFKSVTTASSTPAYGAIVFTEDKTQKATHFAECDGELYKKETTRLMTELMDLSLTEFFSYFK
jgi:hypothetical protein